LSGRIGRTKSELWLLISKLGRRFVGLTFATKSDGLPSLRPNLQLSSPSQTFETASAAPPQFHWSRTRPTNFRLDGNGRATASPSAHQRTDGSYQKVEETPSSPDF